MSALLLSLDKSAVCLELSIEFLQRSCIEPVQRNVADFRDDMLVDALFVGFLCVLKRVLAVGLIPEVHPLASLIFSKIM